MFKLTNTSSVQLRADIKITKLYNREYFG